MENEQEKPTVSSPTCTALLCCPFCGGAGVVTIRPRGFRVECENRKTYCSMNMRTRHASETGLAKELWNKRAT